MRGVSTVLHVPKKLKNYSQKIIKKRITHKIVLYKTNLANYEIFYEIKKKNAE